MIIHANPKKIKRGNGFFMTIRTDLALESCEALAPETPGLQIETEETPQAKVTRISVLDAQGAAAAGKPVGRYVTVEVAPFATHAQYIDGSFPALRAELSRMLPPAGEILVAGLGNPRITPDAFGPRCAAMMFATRHITGELLAQTGLQALRPVSVLTTGVLGETGAEASEWIRGAVEMLHPAAVVALDALAARSVEHLGNTVQLCDTGIVPGSGVGNARQEISAATIGVPVIAVGVPTVVDAAALLAQAQGTPEAGAEAMMVTPREIDLLIERAAKLTALALNCALQPEIAPEDMLILTA